MNVLRALGWVLAYLLTLLVVPANAADLTANQAMQIYTLVVGEMGVGVPEKPPRIRTGVAIEELQSLVCPGQACRPKAAYMAGVIYLRDDMDFSNPYDSAVLGHEMAHYVQEWKAGRPAKDCNEYLMREHGAHAIEFRLVEKANLNTWPVRARMTSMACQ